MVWGDIRIIFRSPLVCTDDTLNSGLTYLLCPGALPLFEPCKTLCFRRIMHYGMLLVLFGPSNGFPWYRKYSAAVLASTFFRSLIKRKGLVNSYRVTNSLPYASHYCKWTLTSYSSCMYSSSKKKRNPPIYSSANYRREMKLVPIIMD